MLKQWFRRTVLSRAWLTFIVMGLAFLVFGVGTYNFFMLFSANISLIAEYGWQALMDGAAHQFVELIVTGYLSMASYVVFKTCEYRLAHILADAESAHHADLASSSRPSEDSTEERSAVPAVRPEAKVEQ